MYEQHRRAQLKHKIANLFSTCELLWKDEEIQVRLKAAIALEAPVEPSGFTPSLFVHINAVASGGGADVSSRIADCSVECGPPAEMLQNWSRALADVFSGEVGTEPLPTTRARVWSRVRGGSVFRSRRHPSEGRCVWRDSSLRGWRNA